MNHQGGGSPAGGEEYGENPGRHGVSPLGGGGLRLTCGPKPAHGPDERRAEHRTQPCRDRQQPQDQQQEISQVVARTAVRSKHERILSGRATSSNGREQRCRRLLRRLPGGVEDEVLALPRLTLLGREDVSLYDGSLEEWSKDPELPLEF